LQKADHDDVLYMIKAVADSTDKADNPDSSPDAGADWCGSGND